MQKNLLYQFKTQPAWLQMKPSVVQSELQHHREISRIQHALEQDSIVSICDTAGTIIYVSEKFSKLSQYSRKELLGNTYQLLKSGHHPDNFFTGLWQTVTSGRIWQGEIKNRAKDGSYYWLDTVITPLMDAAGMPHEYIAIFKETTQYRQAEEKINELLLDACETNEELRASEEELRQTLEHAIEVNKKIAQSEEKYRLISESMRDMICLHDINGIFTYVSQSVQPLLGYEPAELIGTNPYDLFHPDDIDMVSAKAHQKAKNAELDNYIQYRIRKKNGDYIWFETITQPILDVQGQPVSLHTASRDITLRKQAEDQRDNFFNHSLDLMVIANMDGSIVQVNRSWEKTFGLTIEDLTGKFLFEFIHPDDIQATIAICNSEQASGKPTFSFENRYRCKDGSYRWLLWNSISYPREGVMYGFARDITERKQSEETLKNTLEELKTRNHELDNYVYKVSHDLRAPLCSIKGLIELIKNEEQLPVIYKYIDLIENRINKSDQFILSIINHSKILNSELQIAPIHFEKIITDSFEELKFIPNTSRIRREVNINQDVTFYNDPLRVNIILKNFVSNAIKYLNPLIADNFVEFNITVTEAQASICIIDNGIGIEKEYIPKMFDMFFRGTLQSDGSGLGLYIVKQTIEKIGGEITVDSELGKGTTFTFTLTNFLNPAQAVH